MRGQATPIRHDHQRRVPKNTPTTIMPQRTRLPSYLQTLFHFRSARPSMASSGLGSDVSGNLSITINTWKLPDISSLHNVSRTGIRLTIDDANLFFLQGYPTHALALKRSKASQGQRPSPVVRRPSSKNGGAERDRTADPLLAKQVLSQLSYSPIFDALRIAPKGPARLPAAIEDREDKQTRETGRGHHER